MFDGMLKVKNSFRGRLYNILKVWKSIIGRLLTGRSKLSYFKDLVTIFKDYFEGPDEAWTPFKNPGCRNTVHLSKVWGWIPRRNFKGLGLPGTLRNFEDAL
ncbi:hypothetical protein RclHR1_19920002 [Rhizophagus clarus]|uniref:Uncharacterized protein n=1 Tax=Rhizophagus clarus TaxID=94130 RepID=A0A2Z6RIR3_9GLOM|nr:hypothetical protein RclHR1_19920002 [Rhizophagus clarus]